MYYLKFLGHPAFKKNPMLVFFRGWLLLLAIIFNKKLSFKYTFGEGNVIKAEHFIKEKNSGGRGIFLYRNKIEPLMEHGHLLLEAGDICIDGGANRGIYSLAFAKLVGTRGRIIAVEPFQRCSELIKIHMQLNNLKNIEIYNGVLANENGETQIDYSNGIGKASIVRRFEGNKVKKVDSITLETLVEHFGLPKINLIKLDLEGAETLVINQSIELIKKHLPTIVTECSKAEFNDLYALLNDCGYRCYAINSNNSFEMIESLQKDEDNIFFIHPNNKKFSNIETFNSTN